jgi:hypothetical protein
MFQTPPLVPAESPQDANEMQPAMVNSAKRIALAMNGTPGRRKAGREHG